MAKTNVKNFVISVGGSLIVTSEGVDVAFLRKFRIFILDQIKKGNRFYLVVGGGTTARNYVSAAQRTTKISDKTRDWLGISATSLNAQLLKTIFGSYAHSQIINNPTRKITTDSKIILASGYKPGWSTDHCAVLLAKSCNIDTVINLSNIDYAYDKDPGKFSDAKKLENISWTEFQKIVGLKWVPGLHAPFDPIASLESAKNKMKVLILNGHNIKNLNDCLAGRKFRGTIIK